MVILRKQHVLIMLVVWIVGPFAAIAADKPNPNMLRADERDHIRGGGGGAGVAPHEILNFQVLYSRYAAAGWDGKVPGGSGSPAGADYRGDSGNPGGGGADLRGPGFDAGGPGYDARGPDYDTGDPGADLGRPGYEVKDGGADASGPAYEGRGPGSDANSPGYDVQERGADLRGEGGDPRGGKENNPGFVDWLVRGTKEALDAGWKLWQDTADKAANGIRHAFAAAAGGAKNAAIAVAGAAGKAAEWAKNNGELASAAAAVIALAAAGMKWGGYPGTKAAPATTAAGRAGSASRGGLAGAATRAKDAWRSAVARTGTRAGLAPSGGAARGAGSAASGTGHAVRNSKSPREMTNLLRQAGKNATLLASRAGGSLRSFSRAAGSKISSAVQAVIRPGRAMAATKKREPYHLLGKMEDPVSYRKARYGDEHRGMYRDEQGILREADGAIAWGFIGQYREKNPALYEEFIYPTYEHGERVEYWGGKVAAWADENRMDIEDAAKVIAFVPEELRKEAIENAYLHVAVKAAQDGGDLPDMGAVFPLAVAGSIKRMGKATGKVTQTSEPNGGKSGLVQGAEGTGDIPKRTYEPSPKHDPKSGWGSPNPIPDAETGQKLLDTAYSSSKNKQLYNIYEGKLIKFQPDGETGWHPYEVTNPAKEVPADVLRQLLKDGKITKVEYNKLLKNK